MNERKRKQPTSDLVGGAVYLSISAIFVKLLGLFYKIPLSHLLGDEGMGYFNAAYTVYAALYLLCTAGVPKAVSILTTECDVQGLTKDKERIFRVCLWSFGLLGAALSAVCLLFALPIGRLIGSAPSAFSMMAIAPCLLFVSLGGVVRGYLNGHARMLPIALSQVIEGVSKLALGLLFARLAIARGCTLPLTAAFTILGITVGAFISFLYLYICVCIQRKKRTRDVTSLRTSTRAVLSRVLRIAAPVTLSAAVMSLTNMLDLTLIMKRLSSLGYTDAQATAIYGNYTTLAVPMFNLCATLIAALTTALLPHLTRQYVGGDEGGFRRLLRQTMRISASVVFPFCTALMMFGEPMLASLFENGSASLAAPLLFMLAPATVFMGLLTVVNTAHEASGHPRAALWSMVIGCAVKLPVSYVLLGREAFGILGAPIGTVAAYAISLVVSLLLLRREKRICISVGRCLLVPLLNTALCMSIVRLLYGAFCLQMTTEYAFLLCAFLGICMYAFLCFVSGVLTFEAKKEEKARNLWSFSTN